MQVASFSRASDWVKAQSILKEIRTVLGLLMTWLGWSEHPLPVALIYSKRRKEYNIANPWTHKARKVLTVLVPNVELTRRERRSEASDVESDDCSRTRDGDDSVFQLDGCREIFSTGFRRQDSQLRNRTGLRTAFISTQLRSIHGPL